MRTYDFKQCTFLAQFLQPRIPDQRFECPFVEGWTESLQDSPSRFVEELEREGLLEEYPLNIEDFKRDEIKDHLRIRELRVGRGSKPELFQRLIESGFRLLRCSEAGKKLLSDTRSRLKGWQKIDLERVILATGEAMGAIATSFIGGIVVYERWQKPDQAKTVVIEEEENAPTKLSNLPGVFRNSIGMEFSLIPAGEFDMGSKEEEGRVEERGHRGRVKISNPFYMARTVVTQAQWYQVVGNKPWKDEKEIREGANYPASYISWQEAKDFIQRLSMTENDRHYRLPTEAEWEHAARCGAKGDREIEAEAVAWTKENTWEQDESEKYAREVAQLNPNAWGLYDMFGNVWEWCSDWYWGSYYRESPLVDPTGPTLEDHPIITNRVNRGGSYLQPVIKARAAYRGDNPPTGRYPNVGFRVALAAPS
jgi:formylglycine-generating enzyme required for sulfatase activity